MSFERMMEFPAHDGDEVFCIGIYEHELPHITDKELAMIDISRKELHRVFAEGMQLMEERGATDSDRIRPCADRMRKSREWIVVLVRYSELSDPLMKGPAAGSC
jgi:hypothetical protein